MTIGVSGSSPSRSIAEKKGGAEREARRESFCVGAVDFAEDAVASAGRGGDREEPLGENRGQEGGHGGGTARARAAPTSKPV